ncbi:MAG: methyl-accepting chemotaxis protein, partial [Methylobacterium sp.]
TAELGQTLSPRAALIQATDEATVRNRERMVVEINAIGRDVLTHIATQRVEAADARESAMWALSIVPACALGLSLLSALWIVTTQIQRPLLRLKGTLQGIARDRLGEAVPFTGRRDEIGEMAQAVAAVRAALLEKRALDDANVQRQSRDHGRSVMLAEATEAFEVETKRSVTALTRSAEDMRGAADILSETVATATAGTALVASASSQAAGVVNSIASAAEELSSSAKEIEGRVRRTSDIAAVALDGTRGLQDAVGSLAQAASEIGTVVSLIRSVADQTNLLALNATIEAARAGAAGRGFAVVASEVKALAGQTALATDRIGAQVSAIQTATESTAAAIDAIGDTIAQMNTIAAEVAAAADQQERASQEIARAIAGAASDAQTISDTIGGVRETAASNEAQAAHVRDGAATVHEGARTLQRAVETFLRRMNAA